MKLLLTILSFGAFSALGQDKGKSLCVSKMDTLINAEVFTSVEKEATVEGGMETLYREIMHGISYRPLRGERPIESKVVVTFIVDANGNVKGERVVRNIAGTDIGEQVLAIVKRSNWTPGECHGKPVATSHILPMTIDLK